MAYVSTAVVVVGMLCLFDLVLTLGVIRRLREHTRLLNESPRGSSGGLPPGAELQAGETVGNFVATSIAGEALSQNQLTGRTLVGFFSPGCQPCAEQLPTFIAAAQSTQHGFERVLAVVVAGGRDGDAYAAQLAAVAQVVAEEPDGPVQAAFKVRGFPTIYLLDADVVAAGGFSMNALAGQLTSAPAETAAV